jgi:hypothetical protein
MATGTKIEQAPTERRVRTKVKPGAVAASREARHSSATPEAYSPPWLADGARVVLTGRADGRVALDPFSCAVANLTVRAERYFSPERQEDGFALLRTAEAATAFVNPPGGKDGNASQQAEAWRLVARAWREGRIGSAVFVLFSLEALQVTQTKAPRGLVLPLDLPVCYPAERVKYYRVSRVQPLPGVGDGLEEGKAPPHASAIVYLPPAAEWRQPLAQDGVDRFLRVFGPRGRCVVPSVLPAQTEGRSSGSGRSAARRSARVAVEQLDLTSAMSPPRAGA